MANLVRVVGAGSGGVDEMLPLVDDATVQFALLKFSFGEGSLRRQKIVFLHINGEKCPVIHRGKLNEFTAEMRTMLGIGDAANDLSLASLEVHRKDEVTARNLLERASQLFVIDSNTDYSVQWLLKGYERQLQSAQVVNRQNNGQSAEANDRRIIRPGNESSVHFKTGRDALSAVSDPMGPWNWVLVAPDVENLPLLGGGNGSVDEMREFIEANTDAVMMGLLRMSFGEGRLRRTKYVFIHAAGSAVSAVQRGRQASVRPQMQKELSGFGTFSVTHEILHPTDLTVEDVIMRVRRAAIIDDRLIDRDTAGKNMFTVEAFREALAKEQKVATAAVESEDIVRITRVPGSELTMEECVKLIRTDDESMNWALFAPSLESLQRRNSLRPPGRASNVSLSPIRSSFANVPQGGYMAAARRSSSPRPLGERAGVVKIPEAVDSKATYKRTPSDASVDWQTAAGCEIRKEL